MKTFKEFINEGDSTSKFKKLYKELKKLENIDPFDVSAVEKSFSKLKKTKEDLYKVALEINDEGDLLKDLEGVIALNEGFSNDWAKGVIDRFFDTLPKWPAKDKKVVMKDLSKVMDDVYSVSGEKNFREAVKNGSADQAAEIISRVKKVNWSAY
jgi:hypothetical protein